MHLRWITLLVGVVLEYAITNAHELPADIRKCHFADSACLVESVQNVFNKFAHNGVRQMKLTPFDPLRISMLKLKRNPNSPVSVELKFKDVNLVGLQKTKVEKFSGLARDPKAITEFVAFVPELNLSGPYSVDGSVLILPIVGHGNAEIILKNVKIMIKLKLNPVQKGDKTFVEVDAIKFEMIPKHVSFNLEGLFNGNKELSDNMNVFINENWKEIFSELQPDMEQALGLIVKHIVNSVFSSYPYEDYFLKD